MTQQQPYTVPVTMASTQTSYTPTTDWTGNSIIMPTMQPVNVQNVEPVWVDQRDHPETAPRRKSYRDRLIERRDERRHEREVKAQEQIESMIMLPMSGGAREAEVEVHTERETVERDGVVTKDKVKTTISRTTGIKRDEVKGGEPTHTGDVVLVQSLLGAPHQRENVGFTVEGGSGGHTEIPIDILIEELEKMKAAASNGNGNGGA